MEDSKKLLNQIGLIARGEELLSNNSKFSFTCLATAAIHVVVMICMMRMHLGVMSFYELIIVICYVICGTVFTWRENFERIYVFLFIEIELHSALASLLLGWDWEFMLYTISLISMAFYFSNSIYDNKRATHNALLSSAFVILSYVAMSILTDMIKPVYNITGFESIKTGLRYFNISLAFTLQLIFSYMFVLESKYMTRILERENSKLGNDASYDPLTKLLNRRSMSRYMNEEIDRCENTDERFCIIMTDIDDFKKVNDTYGHDMGDVVLSRIAEIVTEMVREEDFTCRWGGEEFLLLIHGNRNDAGVVAERIRKSVNEEIFTTADKKTFNVSLTLGVSEYQSGRELRTLIEAADKKLYYGKANGKNQVVL